MCGFSQGPNQLLLTARELYSDALAEWLLRIPWVVALDRYGFLKVIHVLHRLFESRTEVQQAFNVFFQAFHDLVQRVFWTDLSRRVPAFLAAIAREIAIFGFYSDPAADISQCLVYYASL